MSFLTSHKYAAAWALFVAVVFIRLLMVAYQASEKIHTQTLPKGDLEFSLTKKTYKLGETISYSIKNDYPTTMHWHNDCPEEPLNVYFWKLNSWQAIHDNTLPINCLAQNQTTDISAGSTLTNNYANWPKLFATPGSYRIALEVAQYDKIYYQDIEITP